MTYDGATWGAFACVLSALAGVLTYLGWKRRGAVTAIRGAAWTILPIAAWLTGTLRLLTEVLGDVGDWASGLVFSPTVWLGICMAGVSAALFAISGALTRRKKAKEPAPARRMFGRRARTAELPGGKAAKDPSGVEGLEGMDEIDAILRKHGIS